MKALFQVLLGALLFATGISFAKVVEECPGCEAYRTNKRVGVTPTTTKLLCLHIEQPKSDVVVARFYDERGVQLDVGVKTHTRLMPPSADPCYGTHRFERAKFGKVVLCNGVGDVTIPSDLIQRYLQQGGMLKGKYLPLYGVEGSKKFAASRQK